jgi:hypothetical protein
LDSLSTWIPHQFDHTAQAYPNIINDFGKLYRIPPDRTPSVDTLETAASLSVYSFLLGFPWHETKEFHILELTCELEMKVTWELSGKITRGYAIDTLWSSV